MKRSLSLLLCALMAVGLFSGCAGEETPYIPTGDALVFGTDATAPSQTVVNRDFALPYYPDRSLNPYECTDYTNRVLFSLLYQGLFTVDEAYQVSPMLCRSYSRSADMRSYTFRVGEATFSDGTAVTASDVAASLTAARSSAYYRGRFQHVTSISASEDSVTVKLDTPCDNFPILLDVPIVKAAQVNDGQPLGTGPYVMDASDQGKWLRLRQDWWCSAQLPVQATFISLIAAESAPHIRDQFEYDRLSLVCADAAAADYADFRGDYELWDCETGTFLYLVCSKSSKLFSDTGVRAALTHAIDRDALVETCYRGFARSATLPASPQFPYYNTDLGEAYGYDRQKFTDALSGAEQEDLSVTLLVNSEDAQRLRLARAIGEMLTEYGLTVTILHKSGREFIEAIEDGSFDLYLAQTRLSANMDLSAFFSDEGSLNYGGLADAGIYAMCLEALADKGNYYDLHEKIMEEGLLCPLLFHSYAVYGARGAVSELTPARDHLFFYTTGRTMTDAFFKE